MLRCLFFVLVFGLPVAVFGQLSDCPRIVVTGPAELIMPGESFHYTLSIDPPEREVGLSYLWTVVTNNGRVGMVRGQGTKRIEVPFTSDNVTAIVEVIGLPEGCPKQASETVGVSVHSPVKNLAVIFGPVAKAPRSVFEFVKKELEADPTARLYVSISSGKGGTISSKQKAILARLADSRITFSDTKKTDDKVVFWLIPAGVPLPD